MALALVVLYDLITRIPQFDLYYTDAGMLTRQQLLSYQWHPMYWSVNNLSGEPWFQLALFGVIGLAAVALFFGRYTRLALLVCWVGIVSIQNRNPVIYQGGDDLLRLMLFWAIFLPWPQIYSNRQQQVVSVATVAILLQLLLVFFIAWLFKGSYEWWTQGSALFYALSLDQLTKPLGHWLSGNYGVTVWLTRMVFVIELMVLPLFLFPFFRPLGRTLTFLGFFMFGLGTMLTMVLGVFPRMFLASSLLLIPTEVWNRLSFTGISSAIRRLNFAARAVRIPLFAGLSALVVVPALAAVVWWNLAVAPPHIIYLPDGIAPFAKGLKLEQSWGMFAPTVFKEDGWLVLQAELNNCDTLDLNAPNYVWSLEKPDNMLNRTYNDRFRKFTEQLYTRRDHRLNAQFGHALVSKWNNATPDEARKIRKLDVVYMREWTPPPGLPRQPIEPILLHEQYWNSDVPAFKPVEVVIEAVKRSTVTDTIAPQARPHSYN